MASRIIGPFAPIQAAAQQHFGQPTSSQFISPAPLIIPEVIPEIAAGTFTRTIVWSKTPDCWLAEVFDVDGIVSGLRSPSMPRMRFFC